MKFFWQVLLYIILSKKSSVFLDFLYTLDVFVSIYPFWNSAFVSLYTFCSYFIHILVSLWLFVNSFSIFLWKLSYIFYGNVTICFDNIFSKFRHIFISKKIAKTLCSSTFWVIIFFHKKTSQNIVLVQKEFSWFYIYHSV